MILISITAEHLPVALKVNVLNSQVSLIFFFLNLAWIFVIGVQESFKVDVHSWFANKLFSDR